VRFINTIQMCALMVLLLSAFVGRNQTIPKIDVFTESINVTDGEIDAVWDNIEAQHILLDLEELNPGNEDLSGYWKAVYNPINHELFILINVKDDYVTSYDLIPLDALWNADHLTVYLDLFGDDFPHNNQANYYFTLYPESNDYNGRVGINSISLGEHNYIDGIDKNKTEAGWFVELKFDLENLSGNNDLFYIDTIGFEVALSDNDKGYGERKHRISWSDLNDNVWDNPSLLGKIILDDKTNASFIPACKTDFTFEDFALTGSEDVRVEFFDKTETDDEIINWSWTFGDETFISEKDPEHIYNTITSNTDACLFITTRYGCNSSICKQIIPAVRHSLFGKLNTFNSLFGSWKVIAFQKINNKYFVIDYALMNNNDFEFNELISGDYLFYALPEEEGENSFPTYFVNAYKWQKSDVISIETNIFDIDLYLNPTLLNISGIGTISGKLLNAPKGIPIILAGKNQNPLTYSLTSNTGKFEFSQIPYGEYIIYPEYPNLDNSGLPIELTPENYLVDDLEFDILISANFSRTFADNYKISYSQNELIISSNLSQPQDLSIKIYNTLGQTLYSKTSVFYKNDVIETVNLNSDILLIYLVDEQSTICYKVVR
jgi:PKD repeat protein